jgi:6-phosphogluconolactonase
VRQILVKENLLELSEAAAEHFVDAANRSIAERDSFSVALSGGSTPRAFYSLLGTDRYLTEVDWTKVRFLFSDERNVLPDAQESNFRMANDTLLQPLHIADTAVFRWKTELNDIEKVTSDYQSVLERFAPVDLVLLGLGPDAHTASLFPHTDALHETSRLAVANPVPQLNDLRFTMTFPAINAARSVMMVTAGEEKAEAVRNVLEGEFRPEDFPAQLVNPASGDLFWLLDHAAAASISNS